ncbi:aminopeptidase [Paenibacillus yanchengensis]|uniref:Aminopeptidase n=1 Tax=Paenibacillus yanchengensis TaxID=2035833 RepID=A0ABW4YGP0_9BACL
MTVSLNQQLERYAHLIVKTGVNVQPGQHVFVSGTVEIAPLVRLIASEAYEAGAANVHVDWSDEKLSRLKYEQASEEVFAQFPSWETAKRNEFVEKGAAFISVVSSSPDLLQGIDPQKISSFQKASGTGLKEFRRAIQSDKVSWTVVAAAGEAWAQKVFPEAASEAVDKLWEAIFTAVRLNEADPVAAWIAHHDELHDKATKLNELRLHKLHYKAEGTDLTIELHPKHTWVAAGSTNEQQTVFMANMPTEEVFTVPLKEGINGYVSSKKPLSYGGNIIDKFKLTFEQGKVVDYVAEQGEAFLKKLLETDNGSSYLGEVALVPHSSPISQSNILFYNTLFDENASHHLALGSGYAFNIEGGKQMTPEELAIHGVNESITHNDFMIGSADMDIDGILSDGTTVAIFRQGEWVI